LQTPPDLAALRQAVRLFDGEVMLEGWAADQGIGKARGLGLLVVTSWRVLFVGLDGRFAAYPILKIDAVEGDSLRQVTMSVWYDRLQLTFDNPAAARAVLNLLRQNPSWTAAEAIPARRPLSVGENGGARPEPAAPSNDVLRAPEFSRAS
jgi:hypothetical protein